MNEITGKYYSPEEFIDYKANIEQPLPMIYQSGYLTIKKFDLEEMTFLLDFPNNEVKRGFLTMVASSYFGVSLQVFPIRCDAKRTSAKRKDISTIHSILSCAL